MQMSQPSAEKIIALVRENAYDVKPDGELYGKRFYVESGKVIASIAGVKTHECRYHVTRWLGDDGELGEEQLSMNPCCGTSRATGTGGHYQNYYGIKPEGTEPGCGKCVRSIAKREARKYTK
jgi:hypothetical protein